MSDAVTPMMRQYRRIKGEISPDVILFFRLGDFYEMFFDDAKVAAPILDIALTKRNGMPMCGVPFHALDSYLARLIGAGRRVAICDQVEDASAAKGIVRREVTRIVTPGTVVEDGVLDSNRNNFLAAVSDAGGQFGLALLDLSTGLFTTEEADDVATLLDSLERVAPSECIIPSAMADGGALGRNLLRNITPCEDWTFEYETARDNLIRHFHVHSLEGFGCEGRHAMVSAAGAALHYVREELRREMGHVTSIRVRNSSEFLLMDDATCANLALADRHGRRGGSDLLGVLDVTKTPMGGRKLRDWLLRPLASRDGVVARHDAVETLCADRSLLNEVGAMLGGIRDLERLIARIGSGGANGRDLVGLGTSLASLPGIRALVEKCSSPVLQKLGAGIVPLPELVDLIGGSIVAEPPPTVKDGGVIADGYDAELDKLRDAAREGRKWLAEYQSAEQVRTGIKTLKVRHNKVFGYYLEVSKAQSGNVPEDYIRKQTLVNGERFITPELKEYENTIVGAHERSVALEYELFAAVRDAAVQATGEIQRSAEAVAELDVLRALADRALALGYVRPLMTAGDALIIRDGRHPVIEQMSEAERFVPNDTVLDCLGNQLAIITGPNMAGKSTYIRQVALIVVMAQMGSFVPAREAEIGMVDRVFTRIGASDDLARGRSTFMVEMQETANILNNATPRSLIVLDEIGRGTSTFDGISIAWAVAEHLHNNARVKAKTLFATHYHELTDLAKTMAGVKNYNVLAREKDDRVVFLRKIVPGGADKSYGIQVARLAGMPGEVIDRAGEILANLEEGEFAETGQPKIARHRRRGPADDLLQMDLFG